MENNKHIHGIGGKTIFNITLAVLYILQRITLKEIVYAILIHGFIAIVLEYLNEKLKNYK